MNLTSKFAELGTIEQGNINGGSITLGVAILIAAGKAGYQVGKDMAQRDNARDAQIQSKAGSIKKPSPAPTPPPSSQPSFLF